MTTEVQHLRAVRDDIAVLLRARGWRPNDDGRMAHPDGALWEVVTSDGGSLVTAPRGAYQLGLDSQMPGSTATAICDIVATDQRATTGAGTSDTAWIVAPSGRYEVQLDHRMTPVASAAVRAVVTTDGDMVGAATFEGSR